MGGTSLRADICLEREAAIPQPGMAETYGSPIEILPKKHTRVKKTYCSNPYYITPYKQANGLSHLV